MSIHSLFPLCFPTVLHVMWDASNKLSESNPFQSQTKLEVLTVHCLMADISVLLLTCQFWADRWFMVSGYITTNDQYLWRLCLSFGFHRKDELLIKIKCTSKIDIFHKISFVLFSLHQKMIGNRNWMSRDVFSPDLLSTQPGAHYIYR